MELLASTQDVTVNWVVLSSADQREKEALQSAKLFLSNATEHHLRIESFEDTYFPHQGRSIKEYFKRLSRQVSPDIIYTHRLEDRHQDHRLVAELTWNTFRDHLIMEYEIPKYEGDLGTPNVLVPLSLERCRQKIAIITSTFVSQRDKQWFQAETFEALLRLRGIEANAESGFAEGLYCRKMIF